MLAANGLSYKISATDVHKPEGYDKQRAYTEENIGYGCRRDRLAHFAPYPEKNFKQRAFSSRRFDSVKQGEKRALRLGRKVAEIAAERKKDEKNGEISEDIKEVYRHKVGYSAEIQAEGVFEAVSLDDVFFIDAFSVL